MLAGPMGDQIGLHVESVESEGVGTDRAGPHVRRTGEAAAFRRLTVATLTQDRTLQLQRLQDLPRPWQEVRAI